MVYGIEAMEHKTTLYLPDGMQQQLKGLAKRQGTTQARVIREALATYLANQEVPLPKSIGIANDGTIGGAEAKDWVREQWLQKWSP